MLPVALLAFAEEDTSWRAETLADTLSVCCAAPPAATGKAAGATTPATVGCVPRSEPGAGSGLGLGCGAGARLRRGSRIGRGRRLHAAANQLEQCAGVVDVV